MYISPTLVDYFSGYFGSLRKQMVILGKSRVGRYAASTPSHLPALIAKVSVAGFSPHLVISLNGLVLPWLGIMWLGPCPGSCDKRRRVS